MYKTSRLYVVALAIAQIWVSASVAQTIDSSTLEAKKLLERLSSTKIDIQDPLLVAIASNIRKGDRKAAAELATTHPNFLTVTVKQMALKMSTREETMRLNINDFAASFIGVTRDNRDARELLTGNFYYIGDPARMPAGLNLRSNLKDDVLLSDSHFIDLSKPIVDLGKVLMRVEGQKLLDGNKELVDNPEPAGVLTSKTFISAHARAGTNRRLVEFAFREFMCIPMAEMADTTVSDVRVARDIDRFPGDDHMKYSTSCKGCHTQMDSFRGAFAYWHFNGHPLHSKAGYVEPKSVDENGVWGKMNKNASVFSGGYITKDNSFFNNSLGPINATLFGWRGDVKTIQKGTTAFGRQIANSSRFSQCMVKRIYDSVCRTNLDLKTEMDFIKERAKEFEDNGYNIKKTYESIAITKNCLGQ